MSMSIEQQSSSSLPRSNTSMVGGETTKLEDKKSNDDTARPLTTTSTSAALPAPVETIGSTEQSMKESDIHVTGPSSAASLSTEQNSSSFRPDFDTAKAVGGNNFSSESEGNSWNNDITQPSTTMRKGSTMIPGNITVPPSRDGNALNDTTAHPHISTATMKSQQPMPAGVETTRTPNHLANGSEAHVTPPRVTPASFARRQPPTSASRPRSELALGKAATLPEQSGRASQPSLTRSSTADKPSVQQIAPVNTAQDFDHWNHEQEARTRPSITINVPAGRQGPSIPFNPRPLSTSSGDSTRSLTLSSPVSHSTDTSLGTMEGSWRQKPLPPNGTSNSSTLIETNAAMTTANQNIPSRSMHRRASGTSRRTRGVFHQQAYDMPSPSLRPKDISTRIWIIASVGRDNIPSHPGANSAPNSNIATPPSDLGSFTSWLKSVANKYDSIIGTLTFFLVLIGVILSGIGMETSKIANQRSDESFRLAQWRNCIDLSVSRTALRIPMLHPGD